MTWDDDKSTATDPDNPSADEQLTADEWDGHVADGHFPSDELNLGVNGSGDPVFTDPQNADQEVLRYDRGAGQWVLSALSTDDLVNAADGGPWETLKLAGYEVGDFVPMFMAGGQDSNENVSSDTYTNVFQNQLQPEFVPDFLFPSGEFTVIVYFENSDPNGDQIDVRMIKTEGNSVVMEKTGITGGLQEIVLGPETHTPSDASDQSAYRVQAKNSDNATQITLRDATAFFGITL